MGLQMDRAPAIKALPPQELWTDPQPLSIGMERSFPIPRLLPGVVVNDVDSSHHVLGIKGRRHPGIYRSAVVDRKRLQALTYPSDYAGEIPEPYYLPPALLTRLVW